MKIVDVRARQILDSRGNPTVEADVYVEKNHIMGRAIAPSGASTGSKEACELRDNDLQQYNGLGVLKAVANIKGPIAKALIGKDIADQKTIDETMIQLDGTENKNKLGANAILAVSLAAMHAAALSVDQPLFEYVRRHYQVTTTPLLPVPLMNIINGGKHAAGSTDIQEFMIIPVGTATFSDALRMGAETFHALKKILADKGYATTVGDEGGFAPHVKGGNKEALELMSLAVEKAGYRLGDDILFGLDVAATELQQNGAYFLATEQRTLSSDEMVAWLTELTQQFPIISIEDGLAENDWDGWKKLTQLIGKRTQLVGDDIFVTNTKLLNKGIKEQAANAILIKPNQIGTLTETVETITMAQRSKWKTIISHRSGETEDVTIAHLAVAFASGQIKTGSLSRTDRIAKYNELLRIEQGLNDTARYPGRSIFQ